MESLTRLEVPYVIDKQLVRGLDYYTRTAFEIQTTSLGAQSAVAGGGRYDNLVKELGGPDIPATGFAIGFDSLAELAALNAPEPVQSTKPFRGRLGRQRARRWRLNGYANWDWTAFGPRWILATKA